MSRTPNLAEVLRVAIDNRLCEVHTMLPGRIESYNAATQKADVKPLIKRLQKVSDGEISESLPVLPDVPVAWPRSGSYRMTFPVSPGDHCMLVFAEQSIDQWQASDGQDIDPGTFQRFDLSDAVAIMGWNPDGKALGSTDQSVVSLGLEAGAFDFVALAQKVRDEITTLRDAVDAMVTTFNAHTHTVPGAGLLDGMATPVTGAATASPPGSAQTAPPSVNSVAAADVKVS